MSAILSPGASMLRFVSEHPDRDGRVTRREWLRIGGLASAATLAGGVRRLSADASGGRDERLPGFGRAKSVIVVFTSGGQSQLDTWDPKPGAPREVRGAFDAIGTAVPGTHICEHLPRIAGLTDRFTIVRSMSHEDLDHGSAVYLSLTGHYHTRKSSNPPPTPADFPTHAAVLKRVRPGSPFVQPAVHVNGPAIIAPNNISPGQFGGFLGRDYDPLVVGDVTAGPLVIPGLTPQDDLTQIRLDARRSLLAALDDQHRLLESSARAVDLDGQYAQAYEMLSDPRTREAFRLSAEPPALRERYGRHRAGQSCLLARRLVEAGVPLVTVIWNHHSRGQDHHPERADFYGWDTHNDIFESLHDYLLPRFDQTFSALLEDLDGRGLLEDTLVVCMGEFGRAPLVALEPRFAGATPGRKHWASVYSIVLAGAGVSRGNVLGRSDRLGAHPASETFGPWDVTATIFHALGLDPASHYRDPTGRPFAIASGRPITALYESESM